MPMNLASRGRRAIPRLALLLAVAASVVVAGGATEFEPRFGPATPDVLLMFVRAPPGNTTSSITAAAIGGRCVAAVAEAASSTSAALRLLDAARLETGPAGSGAEYRVAVARSLPPLEVSNSSAAQESPAALAGNTSLTSIARFMRAAIAASLAASSPTSSSGQTALELLELAAVTSQSAAWAPGSTANTTSAAASSSDVAAGLVVPTVYDASAERRRAGPRSRNSTLN